METLELQDEGVMIISLIRHKWHLSAGIIGRNPPTLNRTKSAGSREIIHGFSRKSSDDQAMVMKEKRIVSGKR